eukprot:4078061-Prymnesium_polylepis.1
MRAAELIPSTTPNIGHLRPGGGGLTGPASAGCRTPLRLGLRGQRARQASMILHRPRARESTAVRSRPVQWGSREHSPPW